MFSDVPEKLVSIINLASLRDLERVLRKPVHPLRFRANIVSGARPSHAKISSQGSTGTGARQSRTSLRYFNLCGWRASAPSRF